MGLLGMGLAFTAVAFVVANAALSLLGAVLWRVAGGSLRRSGPLFALRMLPTAGSAFLVIGLVAPAFWLFEPRASSERVGPALVAVVAAAGALVAAGAYRALASWRDTRRLERAWRAAAVRSAGLAWPVRAYRVRCETPLAVLVGVVRPRLFVSGAFLDALSAAERRAVLEHEAAHLLSFDNLKRTLMALAPDWLALMPMGREIERAWANAAEDEADDHASGPDRGRGLDLAGALLKASRRMPTHRALVSSFADEAAIARRVTRLLEGPPACPKSPPAAVSPLVWAVAVLGAAALLAGPALPAVYAMTEAAVRLLG